MTMTPRIPKNLYRLSTRLFRYVSNRIEREHQTDCLTWPVLVNSVPKSGTHLLKNMVLTIPGARYVGDMTLAVEKHVSADRLRFVKKRICNLRSGCVYIGHIPYSREIAEWLNKQGIKQLFIYRDPRDVTVSMYHYIMREIQPRHAFYGMFSNLGNDSQRLLGAIRGIGEGQTEYRLSSTSLPNIRIMYEIWMDWIRDEHTFALCYEDLVGKGGQQSHSAASTVIDMLQFLEVYYDMQLIDAILTKGMDAKKSPNFRRGGSGAWREEYTAQHIKAFKEITGDLLIELGYEQDLNW